MDSLQKKIAIFGASGQGREVADLCAEKGYSTIIFLVNNEKETSIWTNEVFLDTAEKVNELHEEGYHFAIGIGAPHIRKKVVGKYPHLTYPNIIHPSATFGLYQEEAIQKSQGNIIQAGVRFTNNISCGSFCLFNLNATVAHDVIIGDYVSVMADVNVSGNVHIMENVYLGVNASILHGDNESKMLVDTGSVVGAGAVVTKDVAAGTTVVGIPAKPISR